MNSRLLKFTVDGRSCYAMKWRDELTENRREINYVIRVAGEDVAHCLLVDGPLRIGGGPDLVSVRFVGRTIIRVETEWKVAVTTWTDGAVDDEGLVRLCSPDVFQGQGDYLRQDLKRMVREYRQGTRECHDLTQIPLGPPGQGLVDIGRIEKRLDDLAVDLQQSKPNVSIPDIAKTLRREMEPMLDTMKTYGKKTVQAVTKQTEQTIEDLAPHFRDDRRAMVIKLLKRSNNLSETERTAAILATEGLTGPEIALRLPHKAGKPRSREAVRQLLKQVEKKTGTSRLFSKGSFAGNEEIDAQARRIATQQAIEQAAEEEESET